MLACAGLDARYILDVTDHVWAEYYSDAMQRWVHLDPCEAAYDTPHLYEVCSKGHLHDVPELRSAPVTHSSMYGS